MLYIFTFQYVLITVIFRWSTHSEHISYSIESLYLRITSLNKKEAWWKVFILVQKFVLNKKCVLHKSVYSKCLLYKSAYSKCVLLKSAYSKCVLIKMWVLKMCTDQNVSTQNAYVSQFAYSKRVFN